MLRLRLPIHHAMRRAASVLALAAVLSAPAAPALAQVSQEMTFPGDDWEEVRRGDLEAYGWDAGVLRDLGDFIEDSANTTGLVVVDRGRMVYDFGDIEELSYIASVRKSVLAMLYGDWVERGEIDLSWTLTDLGIDDVQGLLPIEKRAQIEHLITARSGVYHPASNSGDNLASAPERGSQEPGTYMLYSNWDFNAAGAVFEQLTGRNIYDEVQSQLVTPLELEDWDRSVHRKSGNLSRSVNPAYHMHFSTRDMARIGHLMLNEGMWDGEEVIPTEWARRIVSVVTPLEEMNPISRRDGYFGYGYMWWIWDGPRAVGPFEGAYTGRGAIGQWITVFPAIDLVVAHKTNSVYDRTTSWQSWERMLEYILEARGADLEAPYPWR